MSIVFFVTVVSIFIFLSLWICANIYEKYYCVLSHYNSLKEDHKYLVMSFDNFKSMYYLLKGELNDLTEKGQIEFYSNRYGDYRYGCPIIRKAKFDTSPLNFHRAADIQETLILFDSFWDLYKYKKWCKKEAENCKNNVKNSNYDKEASTYLISLLKNQQDYHEQEYEKAIQQASEIVKRCL